MKELNEIYAEQILLKLELDGWYHKFILQVAIAKIRSPVPVVVIPG